MRARELTAPGAGGLSVLELAGPGALERARDLAPGTRLRPGSMALARLALAGEALDEALVCVLGPERVELHVHASPPLVRRLLAGLGGSEASSAPEPRTNAEWAARLLPEAASEAGARILLDQQDGALERELERLSALADRRLPAAVGGLLERSRRALLAVRPARVVLAGPVNAGKSTLFNQLVGHERAIVSEEEGTTRDAVCERALLGRWPVDLYDTAGEGAPPGTGAAAAVERAGRRVARAARARADLVLWLAPPGAPDPPPAEPGVPLVVLPGRPDLRAGVEPGAGGAGAARRGETARAVVAAAFRRALGLPREPRAPGRGAILDPARARALQRAARGGARALRRALGAR